MSAKPHIKRPRRKGQESGRKPDGERAIEGLRSSREMTWYRVADQPHGSKMEKGKRQTMERLDQR